MSDEPAAPAIEPIEPMTGAEFVRAHPDLARALARLAVSGADTPAERPGVHDDRDDRD